jgi:hypothetical protein
MLSENMAQIEAIQPIQPQSPAAPDKQEPKAVHAKAKARKRGRPKKAPAAQAQGPASQAQEPQVEMHTAEEWERILQAQTPAKPLTKEEFLAKLSPARVDNKKMIADVAGAATAMLGRMQVNADEALGVQRRPGLAQPAQPVKAPAQAARPPSTNTLQEIKAPGGTGPLAALRENPVMAGGMAFIGLLMALIGTYGAGALAAVMELLGFGIFIIGAIFMYGNARKLRR